MLLAICISFPRVVTSYDIINNSMQVYSYLVVAIMLVAGFGSVYHDNIGNACDSHDDDCCYYQEFITIEVLHQSTSIIMNSCYY